MKRLDDDTVLEVMRQEWNKRVKALTEDVELELNHKAEGGETKPLVTPGLKVRHKSSQLRYTVNSVSRRDVILKTPEGEDFIVDGPEFESDYELD